tara:strand:- start:7070 stop:8062 length:993 start_codon:yes stop_codon:yes gene_type:complete
MAQAASYNVAGNREQILDVLTILEPEETPVVSMAKKLSATATFVEWQVDNLAQPNISGVGEGEDVSSFDNKAINRTKLGNYVQKFRRQWMVSDIQELVNTAGVSSEVANSEAKSLRELKIDLEVAICSSEDRQAEGGSGSPYITRGLGKWLGNSENISSTAPADLPAAYTLPTGSSDGTGTITEVIFNSVLQSRYETVGSAGSKLTLVAGPALKAQISDFTRSGVSATAVHYNVNQEAASKTVTLSVNVYDGDFGLVNIIPTLFNNRTAAAPNTLDDDFGYLIDPDLIGLMVLKAESNTELENQGGGRRGYTDVIAGLACFNPLGFGVFG